MDTYGFVVILATIGAVVVFILAAIGVMTVAQLVKVGMADVRSAWKDASQVEELLRIGRDNLNGR